MPAQCQARKDATFGSRLFSCRAGNPEERHAQHFHVRPARPDHALRKRLSAGVQARRQLRYLLFEFARQCFPALPEHVQRLLRAGHIALLAIGAPGAPHRRGRAPSVACDTALRPRNALSIVAPTETAVCIRWLLT